MVSVKELKAILKENKIHCYAYWNKKRLLSLVNEHDLLPKKAPEKVKSIETGEIKTFPSIHKVAKFIDLAPMTVNYWGRRKGVWKNKYKVTIQ